jgi:hypothetical protein
MEETEVEALLGDNAVHYSATGFATMARNLIEMVEGPRSVFQAEKRGRVVEEGLPDVGSWRRGNTEWLFNPVSGLGGWRGGRANRGRGQQMSAGQPRGGQDGGMQRGGQGSGPRGGRGGRGSRGSREGGSASIR